MLASCTIAASLLVGAAATSGIHGSRHTSFRPETVARSSLASPMSVPDGIHPPGFVASLRARIEARVQHGTMPWYAGHRREGTHARVYGVTIHFD